MAESLGQAGNVQMTNPTACMGTSLVREIREESALLPGNANA